MDSARVQSIDALKAFKASLWKFGEVAGRVLTDADGEMQRMLIWLEAEQRSYWQGQIRKRSELVTRARDAMLSKKLYKNVDGTRPTAIEEEKALKLAIRRLEEANQKFENVHQYTRRLQKEILLYRGQVQRLTNSVQIEVPMTASHLDNLVTSLEAYLAGGRAEEATASPEVAAWSASAGEPPEASMARPEPSDLPEPNEESSAPDAGQTDDANERETSDDPPTG